MVGVARRTLAVAALALAALLAGAGRADAALARGMDVSHWNGAINWLSAFGDGYSFVFVKATEGATLTDPTYAINRAGAAALGMRVGAYHFARPGGRGDAGIVANAIGQADHFVDVAQPTHGDLPPVLDLEATGKLDASALAEWTQAWLDEVEARTGAKALIYGSPNFWKEKLDNSAAFVSYPLWVAHWTKSSAPILPAGNWGGRGWTFWQWTDCSPIPGFAHCADGDRYNGSSAASVAIPAGSTAPASATVPPSVVGTPQAGQLLVAVAGRWQGARPISFGYQWSRCDAAGAGCSPIDGATKDTYTPTPDDAGHALVVSVAAAAGGAIAVSPATLAVASGGKGGKSAPTETAPVATSPPEVTGTPEAGQTLSALSGTWNGSPTEFAYQWRRCDASGAACAAIPGASASSQYVVGPQDVGATLSLVVTATGAGGSRSATSAATTVVAAAPVPEASVGSAVAQPGVAGAVTTADQTATVSWQPGAVPVGATVSLAPSTAKLPIAGTVLSLGSTAALGFPVDVEYAAAPTGAVAGTLPDKGPWQAVPELTSPMLPEGQLAGSYRDAAGLLHVLTRAPGRIALFTAGGWGDPSRVSSAKPTLQQLTGSLPLRVQRRADGSLRVITRLLLSSQARITLRLVAPGGRHPSLIRNGSRFGMWLHGRPVKTIEIEQLTPGALPLRLRLSAAVVRPGVRYRLVLHAVDPYNRKTTLVLPIRR